MAMISKGWSDLARAIVALNSGPDAAGKIALGAVDPEA
jgi:hypothetical protein